jgi:predicted transcriptional regulator
MAEIVTLELPETLAQRAKEIAILTNRRIEDVLFEWIDRASTELPVESLPDDWVLALCDMQMESEQQEALSELLEGNREGQLDNEQTIREGIEASERGEVIDGEEVFAELEEDIRRTATNANIPKGRGWSPGLF